MSADQFTPGPWYAEHRAQPDGMYRTEVFNREGKTIVFCDWTPRYAGNGVTTTDRAPNARLIAQAPELHAIARKLAALAEGLENGSSAAEHAATRLALEAKDVLKKVAA